VRNVRSDEEKAEIVKYWKKHGRQACMEKFKCSDVSIYKYNKDLGLYPSVKSEQIKEKAKKAKKAKMIEIEAEPPDAGIFVLHLPKLVIKTKNVEVISDN